MAKLIIPDLTIAVYKGDPIDSQEYRHTALFFQFENQSSTLFAHVTGPSGGFIFEYRKDYDPSTSNTLAKLVNVASLSNPTNSDQLIAILRAVPIRNNDREFNCQTWVENALQNLKTRQFLTDKNYHDGVNGMVDVIAEAEDDQ